MGLEGHGITLWKFCLVTMERIMIMICCFHYLGVHGCMGLVVRQCGFRDAKTRQQEHQLHNAVMGSFSQIIGFKIHDIEGITTKQTDHLFSLHLPHLHGHQPCSSHNSTSPSPLHLQHPSRTQALLNSAITNPLDLRLHIGRKSSNDVPRRIIFTHHIPTGRAAFAFTICSPTAHRAGALPYHLREMAR